MEATANESTVHPLIDKPAGLKWTGHPLVDMGTAILTAFSERATVEEVTLGDLERFAEYAEGALFTKTVRSHASVVFTQNTPYLQNSFCEERQRQAARSLVRSFRVVPPVDGSPCTYCGRPALKLETRTGRAYRELVPMLTGRGVVNFFPSGDHGLPVCGLCLTALQALAIGAPSCEGRALVLSADDPSQVVAVIRTWLPDIRRRVQLSQATGEKIDTWKAPRSRLVERLVELEERNVLGAVPTSFTIYHLSNSGQGPTINIYSLPASVVAFVRRAQAQAYRAAWTFIIRRFWIDTKRRPAEQDPDVADRVFWRNRVYEDLFGLPQYAARFVRRYFLGPLRDVRSSKDAEHRPAMWGLAELFLREVVGMHHDRIEAIRALGDGLAEEIASYDHRIFRRVYQASRYPAVRRLLLQINSSRLARAKEPLLDFEGFLKIFEVNEEFPQADWRLAWDLVLIRVMDELYRRGIFGREQALASELEQVALESLEEAEELSEVLAS